MTKYLAADEARQYKILRDFRVGSVSDPKKMIAGNTFRANILDEDTAKRIEKWVEMGWIEAVE